MLACDPADEVDELVYSIYLQNLSRERANQLQRAAYRVT